MLVRVFVRGRWYRWIAPFEVLPPKRNAEFEGVRGRFTGYVELEGRDYEGRMPVTEFRGWVWQESRCLDARQDASDCRRKSFFSLRLPVEELIADLLRDRSGVWPPADLNDIKVDIVLLPPGEQASRADALFDSAAPEAIPLFSLEDLAEYLQAGETLRVGREDGAGAETTVRGQNGADELRASNALLPRLLAGVIRRLPSGADEDADASIDQEDRVVTPAGNYRVVLHGDPGRVINRALGVTASRLSWFVGAVMIVIVLAWLVIEIGVIRRIAHLTQRARQFPSWREESEFVGFDFRDLEGSDELGILAGRLDQLLARVKEDADRERIRVAQEKEQWHAVGHEIMSPLQSLLALHGDAADPSHRYIARMQQAIRVLYGSASPSEAFQSSTVAVETLDLDDFLANIAANAPHIGVDDVRYAARGAPVPVRADEYSLEDVIGHLLKNAERHRVAGTPIELALDAGDKSEPGWVAVKVHNTGPTIAPEWLEKIFEYGFSGSGERSTDANRGQGLFVAKTYMAKMGGTIEAVNEGDGVSFYLRLKRAEGE